MNLFLNLEEWRKGINLCIKNVIQFYKDGILLMKNKSFSHACFSFITSFEEAAVAYFIMENFDNPKPKQLKDLFDHRRKLSLSSFKSAPFMARNYSIVREYLNIIEKKLLQKLDPKDHEFSEEDMLDFGKSLREQNNLMYLRNRSIYVRMNRTKTSFITPKMIKEGIVKALYNLLSIFIPQLLVERDFLFKFGSSSLEMMKCELQLAKAINSVFEISEILNEGSIERLNETQSIDLQDSDFFIDLIMNRKKYNLDNKDLLTDVTRRILKPLASKFTNLLKNKEFKSQYKFAMERFQFYSPKLAESTNIFYEILERISENTFKIQDFPILLDLFKYYMDSS